MGSIVGLCPSLAARSRSEAAKTMSQGMTCHLSLALAHDHLGSLTKGLNHVEHNVGFAARAGDDVTFPKHMSIVGMVAADQEDSWRRAGEQGAEWAMNQSSVGQSTSHDIKSERPVSSGLIVVAIAFNFRV